MPLIPVPREQYLISQEAQIRSRALPANKPCPLTLAHLTIIETLDDSLDAHKKAASQHLAMNRLAHHEHHSHIATDLHQAKLWHLDRLATLVSL